MWIRWWLLLGAVAAGVQAGEAIETLTLRESFGVDHARQVVEFRLARLVSSARVVDSAGQEVASQLVDGGRGILIETDLPAHAVRSWTVEAGRARLPAEPAVVVETDFGLPAPAGGAPGGGLPMLAIGTGTFNLFVPTAKEALLAGVKPVQLPVNVPAEACLLLPAPIQALSGGAEDVPLSGRGNVLAIRATRLLGLRTTVVERGPLRAVVKVRYDVATDAYRYGHEVTRGATSGFYECTLRLEAGLPAIVLTEYANVDFCWGMDVYGELRPDRARYQGHHASRVEFGAGADGKVYRQWHERSNEDATVTLDYGQAVRAGYSSGEAMRPWMAVWNPWCVDSGWYWQLYREEAPGKAPVLGIFAGRASLALGAGASGTGITTLPPAKAGLPPRCVIVSQSTRRAADGRVSPESRWQWGLFLGTKGADLRPPKEVQGIARVMDRVSGLNLTKVAAMRPAFADPPQGYGALYMDRAALQDRIDRLRADTKGPHGGGYYTYLYNADPMSRPLVDYWADPSEARRQAAADGVMKTAHGLADALANGQGIYDFHYHYWHGGLAMMRHGLWIDQLLADPGLTGEQRAGLKAAAVLFGEVLWDDDFVPLFEGHGLNLGTANMPVQQTGYRHFYALLLATHPDFRERANRVDAETRAMVPRLVNEAGAEIGCPHYIAASMAPTLSTLMQLKQLGRPDPFKDQRLRRFGEFYLNLLTPPEPRVGGKRCFISLGDSSTEPSELYGVLATALRDADPSLSARLMAAWEEGGKPHSGFFGTTYLMIDERLKSSPLALGNADVPGYLSVRRLGAGTPDETAVWLVNGEFYSDHRHEDRGNVVVYALGAPLSLDWGSIYTPHVPGGLYHSVVFPESKLPAAWNADSPPLGADPGWRMGAAAERLLRGEAGMVSACQTEDTVWRRRVQLVGTPASPAIVIEDLVTDFDGKPVPGVLTLNLAAAGPVKTPAGEVTPELRTHPAANHNGQDPAHQLASVSPVVKLSKGVNRFDFTGQFGVDFAVLVVSKGPGEEAVIGNWAVSAWGGHMTQREERQDILRVHGSGFAAVIVPWRHGQPAPKVEATVNKRSITLKSGAWQTTIDTR